MATKAKKTRKAPKPATGINEAALTKGEIRKLNALRKSLGDKIADQAFMKWLQGKSSVSEAAPRDKNADLIADTLGQLVKDSGLRIPRGGYVVSRGRGRVIVTSGKS